MHTGRVIEEHKTNYVIFDDGKEYIGVVRGKFHTKDNQYPKVGDYVVYEPNSEGQVTIESILPRKTEIVRKSSGNAEPQVIAVNIDLICIVVGLDGDFNLNRLERYVILAKQSGIDSVILLNKADIVSDPEEFVQQVLSRFPDNPVHAVSSVTGLNMEKVLEYFKKDITTVLLGSSGSGKSTMTNWLLSQNVQVTEEVREDDSRGRHTTTSRQMFTLPSGGYLIDTPGMRELGLIEDVNVDIFSDIEELLSLCEFRDCDHQKSAGCAIQKALDSGVLEQKRYNSYLKLKEEKVRLDAKNNKELERQKKNKLKKLRQGYFKMQKQKYFEPGEEDV